ncbi:sensor histidine kinase [Maricaulis sp.]|uniref:sensor histidine kinase n=1 Tax=Maricaulis sp. TaxID=1486257 RepID=UPI003A8FF6A2
MTLDTLIAPLRRLDPNVQVRLWGLALTLALTLTDTLGTLSASSVENPKFTSNFLAYLAAYAASSAIVCQLVLTPFLDKGTPVMWRWLAAIVGIFANSLVEVGSYGLFVLPDLLESGARFLRVYFFSMLATSGPRVVLWVSVMLVLVHQLRRRKEEARVRDLENVFTQARLARLETQINPHFLFNALNTISALISLERKPDAVGAVAALGELLRRSLKLSATPLASVADEIESASLYLQIEALRFPDRLTVIWNIADRYHNLSIPRFTLQPLLENVVKHSVATSVDMVTATVEIIETEDSKCRITVRNDGYVPAAHKRCSEAEGSGIGLLNLKQRTEILFPDAGKLVCGPVDAQHYECTLTLPMHPAESGSNQEDNAQ